MHHPEREQEHRRLAPPHLRGGASPDQVADDGEVAARVGDRREEPLPLGEPLAVDLDVEDDDGDGEDPPEDDEGGAVRGDEGGGFEDEEPGDPRGKQVINADVVGEFGLNHGEEEEAAEEVEEREEGEDEERERPGNGEEREQEVVVRMEEDFPQQRLTAERKGDSEIAGVSSR